MFFVNFAEAPVREITRKSNAVKIAERDGALFVLDPNGVVVWGEKPAPVETPKPKKATERRPYRLTGATAAADEARAAEVASIGEYAQKAELVPAEEIEEGDIVMGRRAKDATREVAEVRIGKKWVTAYDENGRAFLYAPIGQMVPRMVVEEIDEEIDEDEDDLDVM